jgi:SNF2 family DNA or RNA helicase
LTRLAFDARNFSQDKREALAWRIHNLENVQLPELPFWNDQPCRKHRGGWEDTFLDDNGEPEIRKVVGKPKPGCKQCGISLRAHQRIGALWLYYKKKALLADTMGLGKTAVLSTLLALMIRTGELGPVSKGGNGPAIISPRAPALLQWRDELLRVMPGLTIAVADATKAKRQKMYLQDFDVLLIGPETLMRDYEKLKRMPRSIVITDDVDPLRNPDTETSRCLDGLGSRTDRYVITSGTPLQKRLPEIHAVLDGVGGREALGTLDQFIRRYCRWETISELDKHGQRVEKKKIVGYKNLADFKERMAPLVLRRTTRDLHDVSLPVIQAHDVMLDLYPQQRAKYEELRKGIVRLLKEDGGTKIKQTTSLSAIHYGAAICAGLFTLGEEDGPMKSMKLDWIMDKIGPDGDLGDEKVVIFANLKSTVRALQFRLKSQNIGFVTVWGEEKNKQARLDAQNRFWTDPNCRVLIGTRAIEQSLNLQVSRHLINIDMILNPARMAQLAGRIRRQGSEYNQVFVHNLITKDSQEQRYLAMIEREAALADHIWNEDAELFKALDPKALLDLITGG